MTSPWWNPITSKLKNFVEENAFVSNTHDGVHCRINVLSKTKKLSEIFMPSGLSECFHTSHLLDELLSSQPQSKTVDSNEPYGPFYVSIFLTNTRPSPASCPVPAKCQNGQLPCKSQICEHCAHDTLRGQARRSDSWLTCSAPQNDTNCLR